ncbi:MAG: preprotein translocase subunit YajC [Planctomycetes bacterium]|nr:preprotein translocase subunit YajC [Planctomycetota bacterium]
MSGLLLLAQDTTEAPAAPVTAAPEATGGADQAPAETGTTIAEPVKGKTEGDNGGQKPFNMSTILFMGVMLVFVYLILFRPQKKQEKKRREMLDAMKKNDHVVTIGGIHGVIYSVGEGDVVLKIDERNDVRIRVAKSHIGRVLTDEEDQDSKQA